MANIRKLFNGKSYYRAEEGLAKRNAQRIAKNYRYVNNMLVRVVPDKNGLDYSVYIHEK